MHTPCCSAHGVSMTCERYRRTHFVEVRPCCSADAEALMDLVDEALLPDVRRRCRTCLQLVQVYQPTGTKVLRAASHPSLWESNRQCPGSFGPADDPRTAAREDTRTRAWMTGGDLTEYLHEKGESR